MSKNFSEAGFGTDLGAEKFFDIKCRVAGLQPRSVVIVATVKAVAYHGGYTDTGGLGNLAKHIENIRQFRLEPVVAINHFAGDSAEDLNQIISFCDSLGVEAVVATHFQDGGAGAIDLAHAVLRNIEKNRAQELRLAYPLEMSLADKIRTLARDMYGAAGVKFDRQAENDLKLLEKTGYGQLPVCIAKTPKSLSDDPELRGRPRDFTLTVNELRVSAGAGFVVVICGNIMTMPGLPKVPAAARIKVSADGTASSLT